METNGVENPQGAAQPIPLTRADKGKWPALPDHSDHPVDDELSSDSSLFPRRSPPQNNAESESKKRPPRQSSRAVSVVHRRMRREARRDRPHSELDPEYISAWFGGMTPQFSLEQYSFGVPLDAPALRATFYPPVRGPYDMLSSPLGQHILDYEPPHGFVIPPFAMYDGSSDPYDHMLHFNHTMILNVGNDRIFCKVFPASLKGPTLAWFHKLPRGSLNSFGELWAAFVTQYLCSVQQKGNISSFQFISKLDDESIRGFTRRFGQAVQQIDTYSIDVVTPRIIP